MYHILHFPKATLLRGRILKSLIFVNGKLFTPLPQTKQKSLLWSSLRLLGTQSKAFHDLALCPSSCNRYQSILHPRAPERWVVPEHSVVHASCPCGRSADCLRASIHPSKPHTTPSGEPPRPPEVKLPTPVLFCPHTHPAGSSFANCKRLVECLRRQTPGQSQLPDLGQLPC